MSAAMPTGCDWSTTARGARRAPGAQLIVFVCFMGLCVTLLLYAPAYMSVDSFGQLSQARSGAFTDHHPPPMAAIWSVMDRLSAGPFGMLLLQTVLFWAALRSSSRT